MQLTLHNAWQEALVNQLAVLTMDVLLAEGHELIHGLLLLVVVEGLLQAEHGGAAHLALLALLDVAHPDALALGAAVLLQHASAAANALGELRLEGVHVIVGVGVRHAAGQLPDLDQGVLGTHLDHDVRVRHHGHTLGGNVAQHLVQLALGHTLVAARVHAHNHTIGTLELLHHSLACCVGVVHGASLPAACLDSVADGDGVAAMAISTLVRAAMALQDKDAAARLLWLSLELTWASSRGCSRLRLVRWGLLADGDR